MSDVRGAIHASRVRRATLRTIGRLWTASVLLLPGACTAAAAFDATPKRPIAEAAIKAETFAELQGYVLAGEANLDRFRPRGPFSVAIQEDREVRVSSAERIQADVFVSGASQRSPLVIFMHGHDSSKGAHGRQAAHLASWGMHAISVQLSKKGPWDANGAALARLVRFVQRSPQAIDSRVDASRIILVGHSFGAFAVAVALAAGAPAVAAILLDPAPTGRDVPGVLRRVQKPVMVLGADEDIAPVRDRDAFYEYIRRGVAEVSIRDAVHEDAQYPSEAALNNGGVDPDVTEELQVTFVSAITAAAISVSATGAFDYAWRSFARALQDGRLFDPKKK